MKHSVKKFSKKSLSLLIALIMVISSVTLSMPMTVQAAWGLSFKEGITVSGYTNNPAGMYYGGSTYGGNVTDYALYVIENVSGNQAVIANDGTFIVQKGSALTLRQNFGTWANNPNSSAGGTGVANNGLHWYYGTSNSYTLRLGYGSDTPYCNAYIDGGSSAQQTSITGSIENGTKNPNVKFYAGAGNYGASNEAYIDYGFDPSGKNGDYFLNKVGTYTLNIYTPLAFTKDNDINKDGSYYNSNKSNKANVNIEVVEKFTVTFKKKNGETVPRTIKVGDPIGTFPSNSPIEPNSISTYGDIHYTRSWPTTYNENSVITSDVTIEEVETPENCYGGTATCQKKAECSVCKAEYGSLGAHTFNKNLPGRQNQDDFNNGFTYIKCDNCDEIKSDSKIFDDVKSYWDAYKAQLEVCKTELANTAKYTAASITSVRSKVDKIKTDVEDNGGVYDDSKSWKYIDRQTESLMTALEDLEIAKYKVTLRFKNENGYNLNIPGSEVSYQDSQEILYGGMTLAEIPKAFEDNGYSVIKWARIGENTDTISGMNSSSLNVIVKKNMEYAVYLKKTTIDENQASSNAVITLNNKSNKVVDVGYVAKNQQATVSVDTSAGTIKIGNTTLTAPKYSFYTISGFTINGKAVASGNSIKITDNIVIKPVYEPTLDAFIKRAENETFLINGKAENLAVKWNQKVVLKTTDGTEVAWIAGIDRDGNGTIEDTEKNVVGYGSTYSFYANSNVTFYTESTPVNGPKTSIGLFSYNETENKVTVVNNFYAPSGYTVKKAGVVLSTKTDNRTALMDQTNGRFEGTEKDFSGTDLNKNQLRISVSRTATTTFDMHALAYIVVQDSSGTEQTIYADNVETIHYTA